jgi:hypothetical protein
VATNYRILMCFTNLSYVAGHEKNGEYLFQCIGFIVRVFIILCDYKWGLDS